MEDLCKKFEKMGPSVPDRPQFTYEDLISGLKNDKFKKIVFLTGAGISVSAGIPDFRSKDTGIYSQLDRFNLPTPESIFKLSYFREKPEVFYKLAKSFLDLDKFEATPAHHFANLLYEKGMVSHYLTQNIDNLESKANFKPDEIVQAHGANVGARCTTCQNECNRDEMLNSMRAGKVYYCEKMGPLYGSNGNPSCGPVKPDIVFFGETLPQKFLDLLDTIKDECDLMIVMGTGLSVAPFNKMVLQVKAECPKVLINMENTWASGFDFKTKKMPERLFLQGKCDDIVVKISKDCGWED